MITTTNTTNKNPEKVYINEFLIDLIPNFIKNKIDDLSALNIAIEARDVNTIKKIGHNWKGVCSSYGFNYLSETGKQFELLADIEDFEGLKIIANSIPEYLRNVQIESVLDVELSDEDENEFWF